MVTLIHIDKEYIISNLLHKISNRSRKQHSIMKKMVVGK